MNSNKTASILNKKVPTVEHLKSIAQPVNWVRGKAGWSCSCIPLVWQLRRGCIHQCLEKYQWVGSNSPGSQQTASLPCFRTLAAKILRLSAALSLCQRLPSGMDSELFSPPRLARSFFTLSLQALRLGFPSVFCKCSWSGVAALC